MPDCKTTMTILGMSGAGKTCYLLGMYYELSAGMRGYTILRMMMTMFTSKIYTIISMMKKDRIGFQLVQIPRFPINFSCAVTIRRLWILTG